MRSIIRPNINDYAMEFGYLEEIRGSETKKEKDAVRSNEGKATTSVSPSSGGRVLNQKVDEMPTPQE